jgi:hypothetical protein
MTTDTISQPFVMPRPHRGQAVMFYPQGVVNDNSALIGYVTHVGNVNIELNVGGMLKDTVHHKDDPRAKENIHVRKAGVWGFSPKDLEQEARMAELESRLAALEKRSQPSK